VIESGAGLSARTVVADAENVILAAGHLIYLRDSTVTTSVALGIGRGGDVLINSPLLVLDKSSIIQQSNRGNIRIEAGQIIRTPDSVVRASGNIAITAPNTDVSTSLVILPGTFLEASSELREACAARSGRPASSFSAGGRGGLPPDPGAPLAASSFGQPLEQQTATRSPTPSSRPLRAAEPVLVSGIPQPVLGSPRFTCRE
jgi:hypothetical protein